MKHIKFLFLVLILTFSVGSIAQARTIGEHIKLAKGGTFSAQFGANNTVLPNQLISSNGQVITGVLITTQPLTGMFTLLYDSNLIDDESPSACMFDVYTPPATTQFYDFTGLGTGLSGSTQGTGNAAGTQVVNGQSSLSQISSSNGICLVNYRPDGGTNNAGSVTVYVDVSAGING